MSSRLEHRAHHPRIELVVFHDEHPQRGRGFGRFGRRREFRERVNLHVAQSPLDYKSGNEAAAAAVFRRALDLALHHLEKLLRDREAKPGPRPHAAGCRAALSCRPRVGRLVLPSREEGEELCLVLLLDADPGVLDDELQSRCVAVLLQQADFHIETASLGELQRILGQMLEHLLDPVAVPQHGSGHPRLDDQLECELLRESTFAHARGKV